MTKKLQIIRASILNPISDKKCQYFEDGCIVYSSYNGSKIHFLGHFKNLPKKFEKLEIKYLKKQFVMPSFYDLHFHWVQDDVRLLPKENLLDWLKDFTWPNERKFESEFYAQKKALAFSKRLWSTGTLGGACYSSIHSKALDYAMKHFPEEMIIGNVTMDSNCPNYLKQTPKQAQSLISRAIKKYKKRYAYTPRFALNVSPENMKFGSKLAKENKGFIQTHLSETKEECEQTVNLFKHFKGFEKIKTYTDVYKACHLLGKKSIFGHCIHLSPKEWQLFAKTNSIIAHCPTSNAPVKEHGLGSGLFDYRKANHFGVRWALGSDIGAGPYLSMFDVMQSFVHQNKKARRRASYTMALFRSTLMSAIILEQDKKCGNLNKGKHANFLVINKPTGKFKNAEELLSAFIKRHKLRATFDQVIQQTYYRGKLVFSKL